jgi:hypothetical protein
VYHAAGRRHGAVIVRQVRVYLHPIHVDHARRRFTM